MSRKIESLKIDNFIVKFDDDDLSKIHLKKWTVSKNKNVFYARCGRIYMHRFIMNAIKGQMIDHINGDGLDNRKENLRFASHQMNKANSSYKKATYEFIGVSAVKRKGVLKKFKVQIKKDGKNKHIGYFLSEIEAAKAYDNCVKLMHGSMAILNFKE